MAETKDTSDIFDQATKIDYIVSQIAQKPSVESKLAKAYELCGSDESLLGYALWLIKGKSICDHTALLSVENQPLYYRLTSESQARQELESIKEPKIKILNCLSQSNMSFVYLVERLDLGAHAVIKIVTDSSLNKAIYNEASMLAKLRHPYIVTPQIIGETENGFTYFTMEHVTGTDLVTYCSEYDLKFTEKLELFVKICQAVQFAHENSILHRDLKPKNIIITNEKVPKLLDFGISTLISESSYEQLFKIAYTKPYASPEQISGKALKHSSDIYSLGVILFELLATDSFKEIFINNLDKNIAITGFPNNKINYLIKIDINHIVRKCLYSEEVKRYSTVQHLLDDIQCLLSNQTISTIQGNWFYQIGKLYNRQKLWFVSFIFSTLLILSLLTYSIFHIRKLSEEQQVSEQVIGFLINTFSSASPKYHQGNEPTASQLMEEAVLQLSSAQDITAFSEARIRYIIGASFIELSKFDNAIQQLELALAALKSLSADKKQLRFDVTLALAIAYRDKGLIDKANEYFNRTSKIAAKHFVNDIVRKLDILDKWAPVLVQMSQFDQAKKNWTEVLHGYTAIYGKTSLNVAYVQSSLSSFYQQIGESDKAVELAKISCETQRKRLPKDHVELLTCLYNLAVAMQFVGQYEESHILLLEILDVRIRIYGESSIETANAYASIGTSLFRMNRIEESIPFSKKATSIRRIALASDHPSLGASLLNEAAAYRSLGQYEPALVLLEEVLASQVNQRILAISLASKAELLRLTSDYQGSMRTIEASLDIFKANQSEKSLHYLTALIIREKIALDSNFPPISLDSVEYVIKNIPEDNKLMHVAIFIRSLIDINNSISTGFENLQFYYTNLEQAFGANHIEAQFAKKHLQALENRTPLLH